MWRDVPFARQRRPIIGVLRMCWLLPGSFDCFCCPPPPPPPCVRSMHGRNLMHPLQPASRIVRLPFFIPWLGGPWLGGRPAANLAPPAPTGPPGPPDSAEGSGVDRRSQESRAFVCFSPMRTIHVITSLLSASDILVVLFVCLGSQCGKPTTLRSASGASRGG